MVLVNGKFNTEFTGIVIATPTAPFADPGNPGVLIVKPYDSPIFNGEFTIQVAQSENLSIDGSPTEVVSYRWEVYEEIETTKYLLPDGSIYEGVTHLRDDGYYYTGLDPDDESAIRLFSQDEIVREPIIRPFFASVPDLDEVNFEELIGIPINLEHVNISLHALAKLFIENDTYRNQLTTQLNIKGNYNPEETYTLGDVVNFNGSSYYFKKEVNSSDPPAPEGDDNWFLFAEKGDVGDAAAKSIGYDKDDWQSEILGEEASSRKDVSEEIEKIREAGFDEDALREIVEELTEEKAPVNNAVFTGRTQRSVLEYPIPVEFRPTEVATAQYVRDVFDSATTLSTYPKPLIYGRRIGRLPLTRDIPRFIFWDSIPVGSGYFTTDGGQSISLPNVGIYRLELKVTIDIKGDLGSHGFRTTYRGFIKKFNQTGEVCSLINENTSSVSNTTTLILTREGTNYINHNNDRDKYQIFFLISGSSSSVQRTGHALSPNFPDLINDNYSANTYIRIWEETP